MPANSSGALLPVIPTTDAAALLARYDLFFLDAFGVLVTSQGALPGAAEFLEELDRLGKQYLVLSNDASRSPATSLNHYRKLGLPLRPDRVLTSGCLLKEHFVQNGLGGKRCIVLGTPDSYDYVREAGGIVVDPDDDSAEVLVTADDDDYPFLPTINDAVTVVLRRLERRQPTWFVLPNPDLVFPRAGGAFGITAGAIAALIEAAARVRDPDGVVRFVPLGKPHPPMFRAAAGIFPAYRPERIIMLGDQLTTDILGAQRFGIDSALVETGVSRRSEVATSAARPNYFLPDLTLAKRL
jgi:HAD superfamily hydrolase (TIGR01450 family)